MENADQIIDVLHEARARAAGPERDGFLAEACGDDAALREQIVSLLEAETDEGESDFLQNPRMVRRAVPLTEKPGDRIGRYQLLEQIGEGGCGVVYLAAQETPVRRRVALKVIKLGMDTRQVVARFEAERQALALMDHPNIARVFDAGATDAGRPFFVMELVGGIRITDYCDRHQLATAERLALFIQVCQAIQHAHQKGMIHRDIKPANILVTQHDGVAFPKVIDFGIAKAITDQRLTDQTVLTAFEQFIGTPAYMSPEQARRSGLDVDTRSDIYSLGVLLYELLTGKTPFDVEQLNAAGVDEICRIIRENEPPKPSTRLRSLDQAEAEEIAAPRQSEWPKLIQLLRGDLDWIVMRCLEKDRSRRYGTANELAVDLQRHLDSQPIEARQPGWLYRLRRWVRRNKLIFIVTGVLLTALVVIAVGSTVAVWRIGVARRAEHSERQKADAANLELRDANRRLAQTITLQELQRAEDLLRANDSAGGVAQLAAILRLDPANQIAASRLVSALIHRNWALPAAPPMRHENRVATVCFSADGHQVLSASWDKTAQIWDATTGESLVTVRHEGPVLAASFSPARDRFVTASADGAAAIWSVTDGARLAPLLRHRAKVYAAEFSGDGQRVLTASADHTAGIWDAATGVLQFELRDDGSEVLVAHFSPDSTRAVTGTQSGAIRIYRVDTGEMLFRLDGHRGPINALAFSPDGRTLVSASADGTVRLWNPANGQPAGPGLLPHPMVVPQAVAFSPDSRLLLTMSQDGKARLWDSVTAYSLTRTFTHEGAVNFGAFSPDGQLAVTTSQDNSARLWHIGIDLPFCQPLRQYERIVHASFDRSRSRLVTASYDQAVQVWNIGYRKLLATKLDREKRVATIAFGPRGESFLSASDDTVQVWNARTGQPSSQPIRHQAAVLSAEFSPDGSRIVTGSEDRTANVWNSSTGAMIAGPMQHGRSVLYAEFSRDGERVVTASMDGTARVWDARSGKPVTPPLEHEATVRVARFSPDRRWVVTGSEDRSARVWNAETGQPATGRLLHTDHVDWVEFSPDNRRVVSASSDNSARIWEVRTGRPVGAPLRHTRSVRRAAFSPDGSRVTTASLDRTVRVWDARTGEAITRPLEHDGPVSDVRFSPDGRRILSASWSGTARVWESATGRPLTEWLDAGAPVSAACFDPTGERIATGSESGVRIWEVPPVPPPVPVWFVAFAEAVAGARFSAHGNMESVPRRELEDLARQLAPESADGFYDRLGRWLLADPGKRPASPF